MVTTHAAIYNRVVAQPSPPALEGVINQAICSSWTQVCAYFGCHGSAIIYSSKRAHRDFNHVLRSKHDVLLVSSTTKHALTPCWSDAQRLEGL